MKKKSKKVDKRLYILGALIFMLILILRGTIIIPVLIVASMAVSFLINNFPIRQIGIELATFVGVIIGREFGPLWGFISGGSLIAFHLIAGGFFSTYILWVIPSYAIGCTFGGLFGGSIVTIGIIATFFINIVEAIFTLIFTPAYILKHLPYAVTNIIFNIILFTVLGNPILFIL